MFENLSERLERSFKILKGEGKITEINVAETVKDIRKALLDADVSYKVAKEFCNTVKDKAMGQNVLTAVKPQQMMVKIVHDELTAFMGSESQDINVKGSPAVVLVAGLNGSGKTTFSGKLALHVKSKRGMKVLLAACDTFRPAAIEQLKVLGEGIGVPVYTEEGEKDPIRIAQNAIAKARSEGYSVVIIDTAGRLAVDEQLMNEISALHQAVRPTETLFVVDAMTGQDAVETAKAFNDRLDFDGVVLTKMDGDTRGGAALSIKAVVGKPIKFVSSGEKMEALDVFHPSRIADRILGTGHEIYRSAFVHFIDIALFGQELQSAHHVTVHAAFGNKAAEWIRDITVDIFFVGAERVKRSTRVVNLFAVGTECHVVQQLSIGSGSSQQRQQIGGKETGVDQRRGLLPGAAEDGGVVLVRITNQIGAGQKTAHAVPEKDIGNVMKFLPNLIPQGFHIIDGISPAVLSVKTAQIK